MQAPPVLKIATRYLLAVGCVHSLTVISRFDRIINSPSVLVCFSFCCVSFSGILSCSKTIHSAQVPLRTLLAFQSHCKICNLYTRCITYTHAALLVYIYNLYLLVHNEEFYSHFFEASGHQLIASFAQWQD